MTDSTPSSPPRGPAHRTPLYRLLQTFCQFVMRVVYDYKAYGRENVPRQGGVLLAANHESFFDPILVALLKDRQLSFLARSDLFKNPIFSRLITMLGAFPVRQGEGDIGAVKEAIRRLKEGRMLALYPEGGRTETGGLQPFLPGFALIVRRSGVPVIPVAIEGAFEAWPCHRKFPGFGRLRVMYGKPLDVKGLDAAEIVKLLEARIGEMIEELRTKN